MGRATVDLPDPLDTPPPTSLSGTDDLLAQMAGEEIDRLLAESGVEPDSRPAPAAPPSASTPNPTDSPAQSAAPKPVDRRASAAPVRPPVVVESASSESDDDAIAELPPLSPAQLESDAELDALLDEMSRAEREGLGGPTVPPAGADVAPSNEVAPSGEPAPGVTERGPATDATAAAGELQPGETPAPDSLMSAAERDALNLSNIAEETVAAEESDATLTEAAAGAGRRSLAVRMLEWLDSRLDFVPAGLRDALGKIAIVTLVNSLAVLIYVLFFRG